MCFYFSGWIVYTLSRLGQAYVQQFHFSDKQTNGAVGRDGIQISISVQIAVQNSECAPSPTILAHI